MDMATFRDSPGGTASLTGTSSSDSFYIEYSSRIVIDGSGGSDSVNAPRMTSTITVSNVEAVVGGAATDTIINTTAGAQISLDSVEVFQGSGSDSLVLGDSGNNIAVSGASSIRGGVAVDGGNVVTLLSSSVVTLTQVETLIGSSGGDLITLADGGQTSFLQNVETILGGTGSDRVTLGDGLNTVVIRNVETIIGGAAQDFVICGNRGVNTTVSGVEILLGGRGTDTVAIQGAGKVIMAEVENLTGDSSAQHVLLGNRGVTSTISGIETIEGGKGQDQVTLAAESDTMLVIAGIETLIGSAQHDTVQLGNRGSTMTVADIEWLSGGARTDRVDVITVTSGDIAFEGKAGADALTLASDVTEDMVVFSAASDGAAAGALTGFDVVANFQAGLDKVIIADDLLVAMDRDGDGQISTRKRSTGQVDRAADELVVLDTAVSSLNDANFASFRAAVGPLSGSSSDPEVLILANDGVNSGLYVVSGGSGGVGVSDVRMLGKFNNAILTGDNVGAFFTV
jgi:hypothetical protein